LENYQDSLLLKTPDRPSHQELSKAEIDKINVMQFKVESEEHLDIMLEATYNS
jgi:hypothetical protein